MLLVVFLLTDESLRQWLKEMPVLTTFNTSWRFSFGVWWVSAVALLKHNHCLATKWTNGVLLSYFIWNLLTQSIFGCLYLHMWLGNNSGCLWATGWFSSMVANVSMEVCTMSWGQKCTLLLMKVMSSETCKGSAVTRPVWAFMFSIV